MAKQSPREIIDLSWTFSKFAQTPIGFVFGFFEFVCLFVLGVLSCLVFETWSYYVVQAGLGLTTIFLP